MSLANFLLAAKPSGKKTIDTELDAIFSSHRTTEDRPASTSNDHTTAEKRKKKHRSNVHIDGPDRKRSKRLISATPLPSAPLFPGEKKNRGKRARTASEPESEPGTSEVKRPESRKGVSTHGSASEDSESDDLDEDGEQPSTLIHEVFQEDKQSDLASRKTNYAPSDETKERRDARTIFIGNLAPDVAVKRPLQKQLHRHILGFVPTAKIESTRFRSVAFKTPTSKLPEANDELKKHKQPRQHERDRASSWRETNSAGEPQTDEKIFLTPSQKKKIAFINKDIHSDTNSVHAYIVFAHPSPRSRPANLPPLPPVMDPFEAARLAVEKCNGTMFLDRMLRADGVVKRSALDSSSGGALRSAAVGDPKLSIFVGNLDFASKEEDLRVFFEEVMSAERGSPDAGGLQNANKPKTWVTQVRMIRDKDTQLGKGFAYVQFLDRTCVDEILTLEPGKLKFAKRKLRVQKCKSASSALSGKNVSPSKVQQTSSRVPVPSIPMGDPSLGQKLVELTKEERKRVKAADANRVARRIAKKKARMALAKQGIPIQSKQRERVRKGGAAKKPGGAPPRKGNKERMGSEKSIAKKNTK